MINDTLSLKWATEQNSPVKTRFITNELAHWSSNCLPFKSRKLRLANYSALIDGVKLLPTRELRFYLPGVRMMEPLTTWIGIVAKFPSSKARLDIEYRSESENYRIDSRWARTHADAKYGFRYKLPDGYVLHWIPLYNSKFTGREGDLTIRTKNTKEYIELKELLIWHPEMTGDDLPVMEKYDIKKYQGKTFVVVAYDSADNAGIPVIFPKALRQKCQ